MRKSLEKNIYVIAFLILPFVVFWRNFLPLNSKIYFSSDSVISLHTLYSISLQLRNGTIPLWDPYTFFGTPLLSRPDALVFYPPLGLLSIFGALSRISVEPFFTLMESVTILHFSFAGITTYYFLRKLSLSRFAAFIGGIIFMFNGNLVAYTNTTGLLISMSWFPLTLLIFDNVVRKPNKLNAAVFSLIFALPITTFAWQNTIIYTLFYLAFYFAFLIFTKEVKASIKHSIILASLCFSLLLSAVTVFPGLEVPKISNRADLTYELSSNSGILKLRQLSDLVLPYLSASNFGERSTIQLYPDTIPYAYVGILPLLLVIPALFRRRKTTYFFLITSIIFLLFSLGWITPVFDFFYVFAYPLMKPFRNISKILYLSFFSLSVVAAYGVENITEYAKENVEKINDYNGRLVRLSIILFVTLLVSYLRLDQALWSLIPSKETLKIFSNQNVFLLAFLISIASITALKSATLLKPRDYRIVISAVLLIDLYIFAHNYPINTIGTNPEYAYGSNELIEFIKSDYETAIYRTDIRELPQNYAPGISEVKHVDGYLVYRSSKITPFSILISHPERNNTVDSIAGVRYVVSKSNLENENYSLVGVEEVNQENQKYHYLPGDGLSIQGWQLAPLGLKIGVFENQNFLPAIRYVGKIRPVSDEQAVELLKNEEILPKDEALTLENQSGYLPQDYSINSNQILTASSIKPYEINISAESPERAFIVTNFPYYSDWHLYVDGLEQPIIRTNIAFMGFPIDPGTHSVRLTYYPKTFVRGIVISGISIISISLLITYEVLKKRSYSKISS